MELAEPIAVALQIGDVLDKLGISWLVRGSVASSLHGIPRATQDIDLVAELQRAHIRPLVSALESDFYIDADMIRAALRRRRAFNVIHLATMTKVDVFPLKPDKLSRGQMSRRQHHTVDEESGRTLPLATPEDIILQKLDWYLRSGGSERQWRDVLGVLKIRSPALDSAYLATQAGEAGLSELLREAIDAAGEA